MEQQPPRKGPAHQIRIRSIGPSIAIWPGQYGYNMTINKTYKTKDGQYERTNSLADVDIAVLPTLCIMALEWIAEQKAVEMRMGVGADQSIVSSTEQTDEDKVPF